MKITICKINSYESKFRERHYFNLDLFIILRDVVCDSKCVHPAFVIYAPRFMKVQQSSCDLGPHCIRHVVRSRLLMFQILVIFPTFHRYPLKVRSC